MNQNKFCFNNISFIYNYLKIVTIFKSIFSPFGINNNYNSTMLFYTIIYPSLVVIPSYNIFNKQKNIVLRNPLRRNLKI